MRYLWLLLIPASLCAQYDVLITNGKIVDGAGNPWFYGDIAVRGDSIAAIGHARELIVSQIEYAAQLKAALRDLLELWDRRDQGQWSWAELQRLDEIRELARPDTYTPAGPPPEVRNS